MRSPRKMRDKSVNDQDVCLKEANAIEIKGGRRQDGQ